MNFEEDIKETDLDDDYLRVDLVQTAKSPIYEDFNFLRAEEAKEEFIEDSGSFVKTDSFLFVHGDKEINLIFPQEIEGIILEDERLDIATWGGESEKQAQ